MRRSRRCVNSPTRADLMRTLSMALEPRVKAIAGCLASGALLLAAIILLIAASGGALPVRAQEAPDSYSGASSFSDAPALVSKPPPPPKQPTSTIAANGRLTSLVSTPAPARRHPYGDSPSRRPGADAPVMTAGWVRAWASVKHRQTRPETAKCAFQLTNPLGQSCFVSWLRQTRTHRRTGGG